MYKCQAYENQLSEYAAGRLPAAEAATVAAHLARCAACQAELRREQELRAVLQDLPLVPCPARVTRALQLRLDADTARGRSLRWPAGLGLVAAALLAVLLVPGLGRRTDAPGSPRTDAATYSAAEIIEARRDAVVALQLAASMLDRSRDRTVVDVFGSRLPRAIGGALRPAAHQIPITNQPPQTTIPGGNG